MPATFRRLCTMGLLLLCACRPAGDDAALPSPPALEATEKADPFISAVMGSAERALAARHPDAELVLSEQTIVEDAGERAICGRYTLVKRTSRRDRFFIATPVEVSALKTKADPRWTRKCGTGQPMPGSLTAAQAEARIVELGLR